uniref:Amino acid permease n=1 Tax=Candidatus Enterococcus clewellii TaxID=1834193 RepID=A0A242K1H1_9ENTE|nr:amino acid permease [Enterococcus sp. 9E7_DIV0242]
MSNTKSSNQISTMTFIGMTCALVASVRNIPDVAAAGWTMLFYMLVAVLLYAFPVSLISGEFAGMFPGVGGPELWVSNSLGKKWGFVVSWLLWVQMFPGMVMVASALAPLFGNIIDNVPLGLSSKFTLVVILIVYWGITLLNLKFDMAKLGGKIGVWLGLYLPLAIMLVLGVAAWMKIGLLPTGTLGHFSWDKLIPDMATAKSLQYFTPIMFIFTGIEMSSVYITRLKNPVKTYLKGIFIALIFLFIVNILNAFVVANVIPSGHLDVYKRQAYVKAGNRNSRGTFLY